MFFDISKTKISMWQNIWAATWDFQQCGMCDQQRLRPACAYAQSDQSLCLSLEYSKIVKLLTEHHLKFPSLKGGCLGSSESPLGQMPHCWKSHVAAQILLLYIDIVCDKECDICDIIWPPRYVTTDMVSNLLQTHMWLNMYMKQDM